MKQPAPYFLKKVKAYLEEQGFNVSIKEKKNSVFDFITNNHQGIYVKENGAINVNERNAILFEAEQNYLTPYVAMKDEKGGIILKEVR